MYPQLLRFKTPHFLAGIFPDHITLYSYGLMIAIGILAAYWFTYRRTKPLGITKDRLSSMFIWSILAGFVGGKLFFFFEDIQKYIDQPNMLLNIIGGGFVFYGSVLFVIPVLVLWLRKNKIAVRPFLDIIAFVGPIVQGIGRFGCFLAGCCHGRECSNFLGVTYTNPDSLAPNNIALYPTQLFDLGINVIILLTLLWFEKRKKFEGQLMLLYLMMYAVGRSINELYRGDEERGFILGGLMSHSQFIAVCVFIACVIFWKKWSTPAADVL
jgi:phosphatidylglycerol---prolipoprotein diacylglyceryl transferase